MALSAYRQRTKSKFLQYLHGCAIGTPKSTLIKAIKKNWFVLWPDFTADDVHRHLPDFPQTAMGHLHWIRQGIWSTKPPASTINTVDMPLDPPRRIID